MSEIEKMKQYIERTKMKIGQTSAYQMDAPEAIALADKTQEEFNSSFDAIVLAFHYGQAKGWRAACAAKAGVRA